METLLLVIVALVAPLGAVRLVPGRRLPGLVWLAGALFSGWAMAVLPAVAAALLLILLLATEGGSIPDQKKIHP